MAAAVGETDAYYLFLGAAEIALLLLLIVGYAWTWPRREPAGAPGLVA